MSLHPTCETKNGYAGLRNLDKPLSGTLVVRFMYVVGMRAENDLHTADQHRAWCVIIIDKT